MKFEVGDRVAVYNGVVRDVGTVREVGKILGSMVIEVSTFPDEEFSVLIREKK